MGTWGYALPLATGMWFNVYQLKEDFSWKLKIFHSADTICAANETWQEHQDIKNIFLLQGTEVVYRIKISISSIKLLICTSYHDEPVEVCKETKMATSHFQDWISEKQQLYIAI